MARAIWNVGARCLSSSMCFILTCVYDSIASALDKDIQVQSLALPIIVKAEMMHRLPSFSLLK